MPAANRKYRLNHHSFKKGFEGAPGDIIAVDDAGADWLDEVEGGFEVDGEGNRLTDDKEPGDKKPGNKKKSAPQG